MAELLQVFGLSNSCSNPLKMLWVLSIMPRFCNRWKPARGGSQMGRIFNCVCQRSAQIWALVAHLWWRWEEEEEEQRGERGMLAQGGRDWERGERRKGVGRNYKNAPPSSIFVPKFSIFDTASLICNPNSKPKINNTTFHRLVVPKNIQVRFNKHRTTPKVDNLIVFGFLIDLVLVNNRQ